MHCNPKRLVHIFAFGVVDKTMPTSRLRDAHSGAALDAVESSNYNHIALQDQPNY